MLAAQRQKLIVDEIRREGGVRVSELTGLLAVSEMTIRRDIDVLAAAGLVEKVHGGATSRGGLSAEEPGFEAKSHRQLAEKEAISRAASEARRARAGDRPERRDDDLAARPSPHRRARPDRRDELDPGGRRPAPRERAPTSPSS
jgi:predicted DNA-binding transcriptional regulator YafY